MNYYERHLGDYVRDTAHLSMLEHGAYTILLDRYYITEEGIPSSDVYRIARARTKEEKKSVDNVLTEYFFLDECSDRWINKRAEEEIAKASAKIKAAQGNGAKGGRPRKNPPGSENETQEKPTGLFVGSENETQSKAHQTPDTSKQTPIAPKGAGDGFEKFWATYPKKIGKGAAEKAWLKAKINGHADEVIDAVRLQSQSEQWRKDGGQYIPNPATWLNQRRWEDGISCDSRTSVEAAAVYENPIFRGMI